MNVSYVCFGVRDYNTLLGTEELGDKVGCCGNASHPLGHLRMTELHFPSYGVRVGILPELFRPHRLQSEQQFQFLQVQSLPVWRGYTAEFGGGVGWRVRELKAGLRGTSHQPPSLPTKVPELLHSCLEEVILRASPTLATLGP